MPPRKWKKGKKNKRHPSDEESSTQTNKKPKLLESTNNNNNINFNIKEHNLEDDEDGYVGWEEIVKENAAFEEYYKYQKLLPESEWEAFMSTLRQDLPTTFRIVRTTRVAPLIRHKLLTEFQQMSELTVDAHSVAPPQPLSWYPEQYAWYFAASRRALKRMVKARPELKTLKAFRQFLVTQTEEGNILRQESVSMVPAFFLDVRAEHRVLDMCAAPGSKTAQLLEALHLSAGDDCLPTGLVVANDADRERAHMLVHRTKALGSPSLLVTHYEAQSFPNIFHPDTHLPLLYDRILCDVPCSGDGTVRKNPDLWRSWHLGAGLTMHPLQLLIMHRACALLSCGGRLVYSTCSFNPLEDEAVVAHTLSTHPEFELVDCSMQIPTLQRRQGLTQWAVCDPETRVWYHTHDDVPPEKRNKFPASLFPPSNDTIRMSLARCMRLFPHDQNSGGFFIAVLTKRIATTTALHAGNTVSTVTPTTAAIATATNTINITTLMNTPSSTHPISVPSTTTTTTNASAFSSNVTSSHSFSTSLQNENEILNDNERAPQSSGMSLSSPPHQKQPLTSEPFVFLTEQDIRSPLWTDIKNFYGIKDEFDLRQILARTETVPAKKYYFVSAAVRDILRSQRRAPLRVVHTGLKLFERTDSFSSACPYRICQDAVQYIFPYFSRRRVTITISDLCILLTQKNSLFTSFTESAKRNLIDLPEGPCIFVVEPSDALPMRLVFVGWRGRYGCCLHLNRNEIKSLQQLLSVQTQSVA
jgi:tRNA (cytosine34-C5)-methyltransferase